jgi:hypothetical protein
VASRTIARNDAPCRGCGDPGIVCAALPMDARQALRPAHKCCPDCSHADWAAYEWEFWGWALRYIWEHWNEPNNGGGQRWQRNGKS